mmetsp:Transcript_33281/g.96094  ORF Transcript_33281/g.96094 Transcript_33281/m.96094 type:complete len:225 (-) Transcript_33281:59-733(-)
MHLVGRRVSEPQPRHKGDVPGGLRGGGRSWGGAGGARQAVVGCVEACVRHAASDGHDEAGGDIADGRGVAQQLDASRLVLEVEGVAVGDVLVHGPLDGQVLHVLVQHRRLERHGFVEGADDHALAALLGFLERLQELRIRQLPSPLGPRRPEDGLSQQLQAHVVERRVLLAVLARRYQEPLAEVLVRQLGARKGWVATAGLVQIYSPLRLAKEIQAHRMYRELR